MSVITEDLLKSLHVGETTLDFFNKAGLIGMTFEELAKVEGDHESFFYYVKDAIFNKPKVKLDHKGRVVSEITKDGTTRSYIYSEDYYTINIIRDSRVDVVTLDYNNKLKSLLRGERIIKYHYDNNGLLVRIERNTEDDTYLFYNEQGLLCKENHYDGDVHYNYNDQGLLCEELFYEDYRNIYEYVFYKGRLRTVTTNGDTTLTIPYKETL